MKRGFFYLAACLAALALQAADIISVDPAARKAVILIPANANFGLRYAAQELSYHVEKATGCKIPVSRDSAAPAGSFVISLGETDFARKNQVSGAGMKHNHARIVADNDKLIITGNDRGNNLGALLVETSATLFAIYDILENSNGVRWLYPGEAGEIIPKSATFNFESGDRIYHPRLRFFFCKHNFRFIIISSTVCHGSFNDHIIIGSLFSFIIVSVLNRQKYNNYQNKPSPGR